MQLIKKINHYLKRHQGILIILFLVLLIGAIFLRYLKPFFIGVLLLILVTLSALCSRIVPKYGTGFECIMLATVLMGYIYGSPYGALFGCFCVILYYLFAGQFTPEIIAFIPLYLLVGLLVPFFTFSSITTIGIIFTLIYDIISVLLSVFMFGMSIEENVIFFFTNLGFNYLLFSYLAPFILRLATL